MADFTEYWGPNQVTFVATSGDVISSRKIKRRGFKFSPSSANDWVDILEVGEGAAKSDWPRTRIFANGSDTQTVGCLFHDTTANYVVIDMLTSSLSVKANCLFTFDYEL